eukprot:COSAG02_NODE_9204_length_2289_cov_2.426027_2_plen_170_part_00
MSNYDARGLLVWSAWGTMQRVRASGCEGSGMVAVPGVGRTHCKPTDFSRWFVCFVEKVCDTVATEEDEAEVRSGLKKASKTRALCVQYYSSIHVPGNLQNPKPGQFAYLPCPTARPTLTPKHSSPAAQSVVASEKQYRPCIITVDVTVSAYAVLGCMHHRPAVPERSHS